MRTVMFTILLTGFLMTNGCSQSAARVREDGMQAYEKNKVVKPMTAEKACLYGTPWRNNVRTVRAIDAREGVGVYYKHCPVPGLWTEQQNTHVLKEMAAAGCKRIRYAACHGMYINADWVAPSDNEQKEMDYVLRGCAEAGIRPTVTFVHIPAMGTGDAMHTWWDRSWNKGLMDIGEGTPGDAKYDAYFEKAYAALEAIARSAREAGFTEPGSYDLEMGQNLWWGFPATLPFPGLTEDMIRPGGQVYEFEKALMERLRSAGYNEPTLWWSQCHHLTDRMSDADIPAVCDGGRAISIYSGYSGRTDDGWLGEDAESPPGKPRRSPTDAWPDRPPYTWLHTTAPAMVLSRPESYFADYTRHDNLLAVQAVSRKPLSLTALGTVPSDIPGAMVESVADDGTKTLVKADGVDGWGLKSRGLARALAFWLNQGSSYVLLHSAYEGAADEMSHALIPHLPDPASFSWSQSQPLRAMRAFASAFDGAEKLNEVTPLSFRFKLSDDVELIPAVPHPMGPYKASDAIVILPFQVTATRYAVAVYVMTPNQLERLAPRQLTLEINAAIVSKVRTLVPSTQAQGEARVSGSHSYSEGYAKKHGLEEMLRAQPKATDSPHEAPTYITTSIQFDVSDDVTFLIFDAR